MADPTPTPTPAPKKHSPHEFDQQIEADLCVGETILAAANDPLYQPTLLGAGITALQLTGLQTNIAGCRTLSSKAVIATTDTGSLVLADHTARKNLDIAIAVLRKAAKDKFAEGDPARKKYFVGIDVSKAKYEDLLQRVDELAVQLTSDPLADKGVGAADLTAVSTTVAAWKIAAKAVNDKQEIATGFRNDRDVMHAAVNATRHAIQSAADRKYPYTNPNNSAARAKFKLPPDREFNI